MKKIEYLFSPEDTTGREYGKRLGYSLFLEKGLLRIIKAILWMTVSISASWQLDSWDRLSLAILFRPDLIPGECWVLNRHLDRSFFAGFWLSLRDEKSKKKR